MLVRLTAERIGLHPVARTCFTPPPNVDSALVAFRRVRRWGPELTRLREIVQAAFAHRRKTLPNSRELAGRASREEAAAALAALGRPSGVRAEALEPAEFHRLAEPLP